MRLPGYILILILTVPMLPLTGCTKDKALFHARGDLTGQGEHMVVLTGEDGHEYLKDLIIYDTQNGKKEVFRKDISYLNPWKLMVGDVDGDGMDEISIGVYKESPLHPVMAKRPFFYNFNGEDLVPKWRGSRLSRPFEDYILFDFEKDQVMEIVSVEYLEDGTQLLNSYKWREFGFEGYKETEAVGSIEKVFVFQDQLHAIIAEDSINKRYFIEEMEDKLEWREYSEKEE
ncbi:MAG: hypothetical protein NUK57_08335 [Gudongella sp.]|nr:hypothetical protein [Gudongella sp.]